MEDTAVVRVLLITRIVSMKRVCGTEKKGEYQNKIVEFEKHCPKEKRT